MATEFDLTVITDNPVLAQLVEDMKMAASLSPVKEESHYSSTETEAFERAAEGNKKDILKFCRVIVIDMKLLSLELTLDQYEGKSEWHLSMAQITGPRQLQKPDDDLAEELATAFFPEGYQEVTEGVLQVRHFIQERK